MINSRLQEQQKRKQNDIDGHNESNCINRMATFYENDTKLGFNQVRANGPYSPKLQI